MSEFDQSDHYVIPRPRTMLRAATDLATSFVHREAARDHGRTLVSVTEVLAHSDRAATVTADAPGGAWSISVAAADGTIVQAAVPAAAQPQLQAGASSEGSGDPA